MSYASTQVEKRVAHGAVEIFLDTLEELHIRCPEVVLSQMIHETAMFSSAIYKENHNCVGMKWNKRGYAKGVNRGHAAYYNVWDCLHDYADWQAKYCPARIETNEQYIEWLVDFGYAEDKNYAKHLRRTLQFIKDE